MLDLDARPDLRRLFLVARARVAVGFVVAAVALWLARPSWRSLAWGAVIAAVGEGLRLWAAGHLRKGQEVTRTGPYRFVGHPLYVGSFVIGVGFVASAAHPVVAALVIGYLAVTLFAAIRLEEATLRDAFGPAFDEYARGTGPVAPRRFSVRQVVINGEHRAVLGFAAALGVLVLKAWWSSS